MLKKILYLLKDFILFIFSKRTVGARALIIKDNKILLIKHTYIDNWYSVGGGVEKNESPLQAVKREIAEEVGIKLITEPKLFNVYHSNKEKRDDYIILYIAENFIEENHIDKDEILEKKWFDLNNLPSDISKSTKARIEEYLGLKALSDKW